MKMSSVWEMTREELQLKLKELQEANFNLRFQHATGQLDNTAQLRKTRRSIAQVLTALRAEDRQAAL